MNATEVTSTFRRAIVMTAVLAALAGPLSFLGLGAHARCRRSARRVHCAVDGPPLQPDPRDRSLPGKLGTKPSDTAA